MKLSPDDLLQRLQSLTAGSAARRWVVAYSGGIDSTVLLHALATSGTSTPVLAVHVDHGLHVRSAEWVRHCAAVATSLGVDFRSVRVDAAADRGAGPEAAAREARYEAFLAIVEGGDCLLSGHHENDQAETLLLNLLRGSGPAGLAGIGTCQPFGRGRLLRPMLGVTGATIEEYARRHSLEWIDDPTNVDTRFDRNFLREEIMPRLTVRWPAASERLTRSAALAGEAAELLSNLGDIDLAACGRPSRLGIAEMQKLSTARQRNLLRRAVRRCGLPPLPSTRLEQVVEQVMPAREDAQPLVAWRGGELRRYRGEIFLMRPLPETGEPLPGLLRPGVTLSPGPALGKLRLCESDAGGVRPAVAEAGLSVRFRAGGEQIRIGAHTRKLKKLMQDAGVLPWMRNRIPLLYAGDDLVAVANLWVSSAHHDVPGLRVEWTESPVIR
jgi:tRNA(Ile)-lysidine synthase